MLDQDRYKILDYGSYADVTAQEARIVREMLEEGVSITSAAIEMAFTEDTVEGILDGHIRPYAGGKLSRHRRGCNPDNFRSKRKKQLARLVLAKARTELKPENFEILCNFNAIGVDEANEIVSKVRRPSNDREKILRGVILYGSAGQDLYESEKAFRRGVRLDTFFQLGIEQKVRAAETQRLRTAAYRASLGSDGRSQGDASGGS